MTHHQNLHILTPSGFFTAESLECLGFSLSFSSTAESLECLSFSLSFSSTAESLECLGFSLFFFLIFFSSTTGSGVLGSGTLPSHPHHSSNALPALPALPAFRPGTSSCSWAAKNNQTSMEDPWDECSEPASTFSPPLRTLPSSAAWRLS